MATSIPQQRAQLAKEMNRIRHSSNSSRQSQTSEPTVSHFDPENEAMMSTRQIDNYAQKLPELRASARKYQRTRIPESDYVINTSALGRAFPDFSQGSSSADSDISVEIGRGVHGTNVNAQPNLSNDFSSDVDMRFDEENFSFEAPVTNFGQSAEARSGKQSRSVPVGTRDTGRNASNRQYSDVRDGLKISPPEKIGDFGSGGSRKTSDGSQRTLAAMHHRVREGAEFSRLDDDRPPTTDLTVKNTRFGGAKTAQIDFENGLPARYTTQSSQHKGAAKRLNKRGPITPQATQQSFILPEMPNISELMSGVFEDGTPVFSRTRAAGPNHSTRRSSKLKNSHALVEGIPVPEDEQAIYLSLKLLQDKVALLEREKAEAGTRIQELQESNHQLELAQTTLGRTSHRGDSALGSTDSDGSNDMNTGRLRNRAIQRDRLESTLRKVQSQLDASERRAVTAEAIIKNLSHERDSSVSQLGIAYVTIEQLKADNESLKVENLELKERFATKASTYDPVSKGKGVAAAPAMSSLDRRQPATDLRQGSKPVATDHAQRHSADAKSTGIKGLDSEKERTKKATPEQYDELFDMTPKIQEAEEPTHDRVQQKGLNGFKPTGTDEKTRGLTRNTNTRNETLLSIVDSRDIANLRKTIEAEMYERKRRSKTGDVIARSNDNVTTTGRSVMAGANTDFQTGPPSAVLPDHDTGHIQSQADNINRRHSDASVLSTRTRRRTPSEKNMTSAFILPDITLHSTHNAASVHQSHKEEHNNNMHQSKSKILVPRPVPVSARPRESDGNEDDATMRPSQSPALALATVIKTLEDEVSSLKEQLTGFQALYNQHDPALSRRKRKMVQNKIEAVLRAIDIKSDQIYGLYDVLEGQKQNGEELTQEQVEVTLQGIGIHNDIPASDDDEEDKIVTKNSTMPRRPWDLESHVDGDEDLPWEGIESTVGSTGTGSRNTRNRHSSHF